MTGWLVLLGIGAFAMMRSSPPAPAPASAPAQSFSAERAFAHVERIGREPHPSGSDAARDVAQYIVQSAKQLGLRVEEQELPSCSMIVGLQRCARVHNILATLPGHRSDTAVLLSAHYDSVPSSPGASDDGAAVAALLETARAMAHGPRRAHDIIFAFVDAEEDILLGASAFARSPSFSKVRLAINFDARGTSGASVLLAVSAESAAIVDALAPHLARPIINSFVCAVGRLLPNGTDAEMYDRFGVKTLSFAYAEGFQNYHQGTDDPAHLDRGSLQHHGSYALAFAEQFADADLDALARQKGDDVFFDVFGWRLVRYPFLAARLLALLIGGSFLAACARRVRRGEVTVRAIIACGLGFLAFLGALALFATLLAHAITFRWPFWSPYVHAGALAACISCFAIAGFSWFSTRQGRRRGSVAARLGPLTFCVGSTAAVTALAPTASHVFAWPAAAGLLALFAERWNRKVAEAGRGDALLTVARFALLLPVVVLLAPIVYTSVAVLGADAIALPVVLVAIAFALVAKATESLVATSSEPRPEGARDWRAPLAIGLVTAVVLAVFGHVGKSPPLGNAVTYAVDHGEHQASWLSADQTMDDWKLQFFDRSAMRSRVPAFASDTALYRTEAPWSDLPGPKLELLSEERRGTERRLRLRASSSRRARFITVWETTGARFDEWSFEGQAAVSVVRVSPELDERVFRAVTGIGNEGRWTVMVIGAAAEGAVFHLVTQTTGSLTFRAMDGTEGLDAAPVEVRPRETRFTTGYPGDQTWVSAPPLEVSALRPE